MTQHDQINCQFFCIRDYGIEGITASQVTFSRDPAPLEPHDRLVEHLASVLIVVHQTGVTGGAGNYHRVRGSSRDNRQYVNLSVEKNGQFGAAPKRSTTRCGSVIAKQYTLKHTIYSTSSRINFYRAIATCISNNRIPESQPGSRHDSCRRRFSIEICQILTCLSRDSKP
jgi:hypothetical protein